MHTEPWLGPNAGCSALPLAERRVPAQVPGDVHLDYERAGLITDPFFDTNHDHCQRMEKRIRDIAPTSSHAEFAGAPS